MAKYDWNTFRNYVAFLAGEMASGTMHPHHDSELISWYHEAFLPRDHYLNNIVLFYHDSPITRSHFMDPTDRAIKGFYCSTHGRCNDHGKTSASQTRAWCFIRGWSPSIWNYKVGLWVGPNIKTTKTDLRIMTDSMYNAHTEPRFKLLQWLNVKNINLYYW